MSIFFEPGYVGAVFLEESSRVRALFRVSPHAQYAIVEFPLNISLCKSSCTKDCLCIGSVINSIGRTNTYGAIGDVLSKLTDEHNLELLREDSVYELGMTRSMIISRGRYYLELTDQP